VKVIVPYDIRQRQERRDVQYRRSRKSDGRNRQTIDGRGTKSLSRREICVNGTNYASNEILKMIYVVIGENIVHILS